ncbi:DUF2789 family protein, partial [Acinetobacter ursingii]
FLTQAIFWTDAQLHFLEEKLHSDGEWTTVIDQLNESLHENSVK